MARAPYSLGRHGSAMVALPLAPVLLRQLLQHSHGQRLGPLDGQAQGARPDALGGRVGAGMGGGKRTEGQA